MLCTQWNVGSFHWVIFTQVLDSFYVTQLLCNPVLYSQTGQNQTHFSGHCIVFLWSLHCFPERNLLKWNLGFIFYCFPINYSCRNRKMHLVSHNAFFFFFALQLMSAWKMQHTLDLQTANKWKLHLFPNKWCNHDWCWSSTPFVWHTERYEPSLSITENRSH